MRIRYEMPRKGWKSVNIPEDQHNELQEIVDVSPEYTSVPEVVRAAIALFLKGRESG